MVKQYLREENQQRICYSCQKNFILPNSNENLCRNCQNENEDIKKKILDRITDFDRLIENRKIIALNTVHRQIKDMYEIINQRKEIFMNNIDQYQETLINQLQKQEETNEINA